MEKSSLINESSRLTASFKLKLAREIKRLYKNKELTDYIALVLKSVSNKDKVALLYYFKKLVLQTFRSPDPNHLLAFQDEYEKELFSIRKEQTFYDPVKWIDAELDYLKNMGEHLTSDDVNSRLDIMQQAKQRLSKEWLTKEEVMQLFNISKSTLNRRIAEGMPAHKNGKGVYFYLEEINEWMRRDAA